MTSTCLTFEDGCLRIRLRGVLWKKVVLFFVEWSKRPNNLDSYSPPVTWHEMFVRFEKFSFSGSGEPPEVGDGDFGGNPVVTFFSFTK